MVVNYFALCETAIARLFVLCDKENAMQMVTKFWEPINVFCIGTLQCYRKRVVYDTRLSNGERKSFIVLKKLDGLNVDS